MSYYTITIDDESPNTTTCGNLQLSLKNFRLGTVFVSFSHQKDPQQNNCAYKLNFLDKYIELL